MKHSGFTTKLSSAAQLWAVTLFSILCVSCNALEAQKGTVPYRDVNAGKSTVTSSGGEVGVALPVSVHLGDKRGTGIGGLVPQIVAVDGGGVVAAGVSYGGCSATDNNGYSNCYITSTVPGTFVLKVTSPVVFTGGTITFTQIARILEFTAVPTGSTVSAVAFATQPAVRIKDKTGAVISTAINPITLSLTTPNGATLAGTTTVAAVAGTATFAGLSANLVGSYTLTASAAGATGVVSSSFTISAGAASKLAFATQPSAASSANTAFVQQPVISVQDAQGNTVTSATCSITMSLTTKPTVTDNLVGTLTKTASSGIANFAGTAMRIASITGGVGYILTATPTGGCSALTPAVSNAFTITQAGVPSALALTTLPATASLNEVWSLQPVVQVLDSNGNLAATDNATIVTIALGAGSPAGLLNGATSVQVVNGVATFSGLSINSNLIADVGTYNLEFDAVSSNNPGFDFTVANASVVINANGLVGAKLLFQVQPTGVSIGQSVPSIQVKIVDSNGYLCNLCSDVITLGYFYGTGAMTGSLVQTAIGGVASFPGIAFTTTGSKQLSASSGVMTAAYSTIFAVSSYGAASKLAFSTQPSRSAATGNMAWDSQPVVQVQDAAGNLVANDSSTAVTLTCASASAACTLIGTITVTAVNGVATFANVRTQETGLTSVVIQASASSLIATQSNSFTGNPP